MGNQQRLEQVQSAKYLGITISDDLDWGQHISEISNKATKTLGFLWCNLAFAPRHTKEVAYKTLVRPKLEYAAPIWHPYHETQVGQVENSVFLGLNPLGPLDLDQSKSLSVGPKWCIPWTKYQLDQLLPVYLYRYMY